MTGAVCSIGIEFPKKFPAQRQESWMTRDQNVYCLMNISGAQRTVMDSAVMSRVVLTGRGPQEHVISNQDDFGKKRLSEGQFLALQGINVLKSL